MFKKVKPVQLEWSSILEQFPHCDPRILHAPSECKYCDMHLDWQALRQAWGIAFTNYEPEGNELPCPANHARGEKGDFWQGNVAKPNNSFEFDIPANATITGVSVSATVNPTEFANPALDAITTQPVVLPNPEPSTILPCIQKDAHPPLTVSPETVQELLTTELKCFHKSSNDLTPAQISAQAALTAVKPAALASAANEAFVDMAALAATLPPEHPLNAIVPPPAEAPKKRARKPSEAQQTAGSSMVEHSVDNREVAGSMPAPPTTSVSPSAVIPESQPSTTLPAQPVEPPKVEKLLNPEQEKEIKERLAKYRNEILPTGGMVPVDQVGGVEIQLRKYVAQFCPAKPSSKTWGYDDWKNFVGFFDNMVATVGAAGLVQHIQRKIGIAK